MKRKPSSYARFYALAKKLAGDRDTMKETFVSRFTKGRTTSLREMTAEEYDRMCDAIDAEISHPGMTAEEHARELKRVRSAVLHRMQKYGIDTADWDAVDGFVANPRIAGKRFAQLTLEELRALVTKLEAMVRKPKRSAPDSRRIISIPILMNPNALPS